MSAHATCACSEALQMGEQVSQKDSCAVIVAGGLGERFGDPRGKQFMPLCGLPLLCWSLLAFDRAPSVGHIVLVVAQDRWQKTREQVLSKVVLQHPVTLAPSGATRQDSVFSGLMAVPEEFEFVAIHDAARPLIEPASIERTLDALRQDATLAGAICATRSIDTLKLVEGTTIVSTPDRSFYWAAQTPQSFRLSEAVAAHKEARQQGYLGTDDSSLVEHRGGKVCCIETPRDNIKVTVPEDLAMAESTLHQRLVQQGCGLTGQSQGSAS